jgi:hypothetical protein
MYLIAALTLIVISSAALANLKRNLLYIIFGFFLFLLGGFRWGVGTDWNSYFLHFNENTSLADFLGSDIKEFAYGFTAFSLKFIFHEYSFFLLFQSALVSFLFLFFLYKYSNGSRVALLLYFLNTIGNIYFVRQTVAAAFFLLTLHYFLSRKELRGFVSFFVGIGFHYTSLALSVLVIFSSKKYLILALIFLPLLFVFFGEYIVFYLSQKISLYFLSSETNEFFEDNYEGLTAVKLIWCLYLLIVLTFYKISSVKTCRSNAYAVYFFCIYIVLFVFGVAVPQLNRLTQYFSIFEQIVVALIVGQSKGVLKILLFLFFLILYLIKYHFRISAWPGETDIYNSIFNL